MVVEDTTTVVVVAALVAGTRLWDVAEVSRNDSGRVMTADPTAEERAGPPRPVGLAEAAGPFRINTSGRMSNAPQRSTAAPGRLPRCMFVLRTPLSLRDCLGGALGDLPSGH